MRQFGTIFKFELESYLKNKVFIVVTLLFVAFIAGAMFFPNISALFKQNQTSENTNEQHYTMLIAAEADVDISRIKDVFGEVFGGSDIVIAKDTKALKESISSGEAECGFVFENMTSYTYYVDNLSMYDSRTDIVDDLLKKLCQMDAILESGMTAEQAEQIVFKQISHKVESLGKDQMQNFFYTYIMIFALYMVILLYGQMVATNVATEKSSRAMEVLITSAKPTSMMFGKVMASCLAGFIQLVCIFGSAILFYNLNKAQWTNNLIVNSIFNMPIDLLLYMLLFFVLGFFIYAFMFGAVGSTASKLEDINTSVMPITLLFIASFIVVVFSMSSGNIDNALMKICSYIPFTSPMAMFTRIAMSTVPTYEIFISVAILIASVFGVGVIAAKIYRVGVLLYGTTPKISSILKSVIKA